MSPMKPYTGLTTKLVIALDVGTTFSGVSYALLERGKPPQPQPVTRFPAQEHVGGDAKIPSILYYDSQGQVRAMGAEALQEKIVEQAEDEDWVKIEWFKLHFRPKGLDTSHMKALPLPKGKTVVGVYADFLRYLLSCTRSYIGETHGNGQTLWDSISEDIEYIITHPNGWEGPQQTQLRRAAAEAGLVPDNADGQARIQFLTEGEASLHFCVQNGLASEVTKTPGQGIIIVDAGGGTVDVSAFAPLGPRSFEEIAEAQCHFQGSVFVTQRAKEFLYEKFSGTRFSSDVNVMAETFDRTTKHRFRNKDDPAYIKFGGLRDKDRALGIRAGQLELKGLEVAAFFKPSVDSMIEAVLLQHRKSYTSISNVFLVGGFAASDFLFHSLKEALEPLRLIVNRPDGHTNKAVADGAIGFYLEKLVSVRVSRFNFGTDCCTSYNPSTMRSRAHLTFKDLAGDIMVPGYFEPILQKGTQVSTTQSFAYSFGQSARNPNLLNRVEVEILSYRGNMDPCPKWMDLDKEKFITHCNITGNLSAVPKPMQIGPSGRYYKVSFDVNISFGPAEIEAYLSWEENGVAKRGPVEIIYDEED